jgi:peptidyl-dipeptidase Dcp
MKSQLPLALGAALAFTLAGCSKTDSTEVAKTAPETPTETAVMTSPAESNPFFAESPLYMYYPQFDKIENSHFVPAFERGMEEQLAEIDAITNQTGAPTLDNTLIPMERSGQTLGRVATAFFSLTAANTNDEMEEIRSEMAPKLSAHRDQILLNSKLFERIKAIYEQRDSLELDPESYRLIEENYKDFIRAGAQLSEADKDKLKAMNAELASLQTKFSQNVMDEVNASAVLVDSREELAGMSDTKIEAAAEAAKSKEMEGKYLIALLNITVKH